jgi:Tfp pilus assembly protein PilF
MTFRREAATALSALVLLLAGCANDGQEGRASQSRPVSPAFVRLLTDADAAMAQGRLGDAGRILDEARSLSPESPDLWVAIARLRLRGGEHLTALEAVDRALALGPDHAPALLLRAMMVRDARGSKDALVWFESARKADPDNPDILAEYAATLGDGGQAGAMLDMVRALAKAAPDDSRVPFLQAVLAARGGEYAIARSLLVRSRMAERGVPAAKLLDAVISLQEGNADSAAQTLEGLAARQPANARVRELLAHALLAAGRDGDLLQRFGAEAALPEASPYLAMLAARAYERVGDRAAAAPLLAKAYGPMRETPALLAARDSLPDPTAAVRSALIADNAEGARGQVAALRARLPASADVASLAGDALLGAGDPRAALAAYARAAEVRRPWPLTRRTVWTLKRNGNPEAAELLLTEHVTGETETATALVMLAREQAARGDWQRAAMLIDHALGLGAGHDPALLVLRMQAARAMGNADDVARFASLLAEVKPPSLMAQ